MDMPFQGTQSIYGYKPKQAPQSFPEHSRLSLRNSAGLSKPPLRPEEKSPTKTGALLFNPSQRFPLDINPPTIEPHRNSRPSIFTSPNQQFNRTGSLVPYGLFNETDRFTINNRNENIIEVQDKNFQQRMRQSPYSLSPSRSQPMFHKTSFQPIFEPNPSEVRRSSKPSPWKKYIYCLESHEDNDEEIRPLELSGIIPFKNDGSGLFGKEDLLPLPSKFSNTSTTNLGGSRGLWNSEFMNTKVSNDTMRILGDQYNDLDYFNSKLPRTGKLQKQISSPDKFDKFAKKIDSLQNTRKPNDHMTRDELMSLYNSGASGDSGMNFNQPPLRIKAEYPFRKKSFVNQGQTLLDDKSDFIHPFSNPPSSRFITNSAQNDKDKAIKNTQIFSNPYMQGSQIGQNNYHYEDPLIGSNRMQSIKGSGRYMYASRDLDISNTDEVSVNEIPPVQHTFVKPCLPK